ncbi:hypothetical protein Z947_1920 [Sulfitobacter geojensis]|nr:hypothetical protein Z947_1920 [Sulfitobacter geojensis]
MTPLNWTRPPDLGRGDGELLRRPAALIFSALPRCNQELYLST